MKCFLRIGNDYLEDAERCKSIAYAIGEYRAVAEESARFGNEPPEASIHIARTKAELQEYPDFVLSYTARGAVKREHC